jgi:hypothetical protein
MRLTTIADAILEEAVRSQPSDTFDSHDVIGTVGCAATPLALGGLADAFGRLAPAMALLAVAPAAVLVVMRRMR